MKTTIINAMKAWAFNSTFFASTVIGFSEIKSTMTVFIWICALIGILLFSVLAAFGAEAIMETIKSYKERWNGIGNQRHIPH